MVDLEQAKAFLKAHHVKSITWHHVLDNTTSTRPKAHGGKVVRSVTDHEHFEAQGAGSATPMIRCTLRLPNSFAPDDGKVLEVTGVGTTRDDASEDACCGAMVKCGVTACSLDHPDRYAIDTVSGNCWTTSHQPLAVHRHHAAPTDKIDMDDQKNKQLKRSFGDA